MKAKPSITRLPAVLSGYCFLLLLALHPSHARGPNVVVIMADDLGYGDLGCYGATKIKTPNIDSLAREGQIYTAAYAPASTCTPSR